MTKIHMETALVQEMAGLLNSESLEMSKAQSNLQKSVASLSMSWIGGSSENTVRSLNELSISLDRALESLQQLATQANREVDQWVEIDASFAGSFSAGGSRNGQYVLPTILSGGAIGSSFVALGMTQSSSGFDWAQLAIDEFNNTSSIGTTLFSKVASTLASDTNMLAVESGFTDEAVSAASQANDLAHEAHDLDIGSGFLLNFGEGVFFEHKPVANAALSAGISTCIGLALGDVMLASAGVQLVGNIAVAGLELTGNQGIANDLHDTLQAVDVGGYVDDISDGISDFALNPAHPNPFGKVDERLLRVGINPNALVTPVE